MRARARCCGVGCAERSPGGSGRPRRAGSPQEPPFCSTRDQRRAVADARIGVGPCGQPAPGLGDGSPVPADHDAPRRSPQPGPPGNSRTDAHPARERHPDPPAGSTGCTAVSGSRSALGRRHQRRSWPAMTNSASSARRHAAGRRPGRRAKRAAEGAAVPTAGSATWEVAGQHRAGGKTEGSWRTSGASSSRDDQLVAVLVDAAQAPTPPRSSAPSGRQRSRSSGSRLCPPASTLASSPARPSSVTASSTECGRR